MGCPVPSPPPEWMGPEAKADYIRMLNAQLAASPPAWLLAVLIVVVIGFGAAMIWSIL